MPVSTTKTTRTAKTDGCLFESSVLLSRLKFSVIKSELNRKLGFQCDGFCVDLQPDFCFASVRH